MVFYGDTELLMHLWRFQTGNIKFDLNWRLQHMIRQINSAFRRCDLLWKKFLLRWKALINKRGELVSKHRHKNKDWVTWTNDLCICKSHMTLSYLYADSYAAWFKYLLSILERTWLFIPYLLFNALHDSIRFVLYITVMKWLHL